MSTIRQKLQPHVLIPWIFALVALFGCQLLAQQKASLRKSAQIDGSCLTLLADDAASPASTGKPLNLLTKGLNHHLHLDEPASQRVAICVHRSRINLPLFDRAAQGRAPPSARYC